MPIPLSRSPPCKNECATCPAPPSQRRGCSFPPLVFREIHSRAKNNRARRNRRESSPVRPPRFWSISRANRYATFTQAGSVTNARVPAMHGLNGPPVAPAEEIVIASSGLRSRPLGNLPRFPVEWRNKVHGAGDVGGWWCSAWRRGRLRACVLSYLTL